MVTPVDVALSYPGVAIYKEMVYTQNAGTAPDKVSLKIVPQASPVAAEGDLTFTYGGAPLTLTNCLIDKSSVVLTRRGWIGSFVLLDRRWLWAKQPNMSIHWNDRDANGNIAQPSKRTVKEMLTEILTWLGETDIDVDAVDASDYQEFNEISIHPLDLMNQIMDIYGYDVTIGFDGDAVTIVKKNEGAPLPATAVRMVSSAYDPPTPVNTVRTHFGPSKMQGRLKLIAIGQDTDGQWKEIDDLSYKPTGGWKNDTPGGFGKVLADSGQEAWDKAVATVYRYYRINKFADDTMDIPDGSGSIQHIRQLLPLKEGLFPETSFVGDGSRPKERLYGEVVKVGVDEAPAGTGNTDTNRLLDVDYEILRKEGVVVFPAGTYMYKVVDGEPAPADLWLECVFQIRTNNDWQWAIYHKDVVIDANGTGIHTVALPQLSNQVRVTYDADHSTLSNTSTSASLDAVATTVASAHASSYSTTSGQTVWYAGVQTSVRVDGAIRQVTHVISDTQGHYSIVSRGISHDTHVLDASDKRARDLERYSRESRRRYRISQARRELGSD